MKSDFHNKDFTRFEIEWRANIKTLVKGWCGRLCMCRGIIHYVYLDGLCVPTNDWLMRKVEF